MTQAGLEKAIRVAMVIVLFAVTLTCAGLSVYTMLSLFVW